MSDWDFWTAEFEGTEQQVAYASDVRGYVSDCLDTVRECAIKCDNSEDDADAIKQAILDGIEMDVANHGGINDNKIWAGKFLDSVLAAFPLKELVSGTHSFDSMNDNNLVNYAHLGGYKDLGIYYTGSPGFPYIVVGRSTLIYLATLLSSLNL